MSGIPILIVSYFFGIGAAAAHNLWLIVPAMLAIWALLLVPATAWQNLWHRISPQRTSAPHATIVGNGPRLAHVRN